MFPTFVLWLAKVLTKRHILKTCKDTNGNLPVHTLISPLVTRRVLKKDLSTIKLNFKASGKYLKNSKKCRDNYKNDRIILISEHDELKL